MGLYDDVLGGNTKQGSGLFDDVLNTPDIPPESLPSKIVTTVGDAAITGLKSTIGVPETAIGLLDIPTAGRVGKAAESLGFRPKEAREALDTWYSPEHQAKVQEVRNAQGFLPKLGAYAQNPTVFAHDIAEQIPTMLAGGLVGRGIGMAAPALTKAAPYIPGAAGEGIVTAGQNVEQVRQETPGGVLDPLHQVLPVAASGLATGAIAAGSGKLADKLGLSDIQRMVSGVDQTTQGAKQSMAKNIAGTALLEGAGQELPQSAQEQVAQNYALGRPLSEGVGSAAAQGFALGTAMGGGAAAFNGPITKAINQNVGQNNQGAATTDQSTGGGSARVEGADTISPVDVKQPGGSADIEGTGGIADTAPTGEGSAPNVTKPGQPLDELLGEFPFDNGKIIYPDGTAKTARQIFDEELAATGNQQAALNKVALEQDRYESELLRTARIKDIEEKIAKRDLQRQQRRNEKQTIATSPVEDYTFNIEDGSSIHSNDLFNQQVGSGINPEIAAKSINDAIKIAKDADKKRTQAQQRPQGTDTHPAAPDLQAQPATEKAVNAVTENVAPNETVKPFTPEWAATQSDNDLGVWATQKITKQQRKVINDERRKRYNERQTNGFQPEALSTVQDTKPTSIQENAEISSGFSDSKVNGKEKGSVNANSPANTQQPETPKAEPIAIQDATRQPLAVASGIQGANINVQRNEQGPVPEKVRTNAVNEQSANETPQLTQQIKEPLSKDALANILKSSPYNDAKEAVNDIVRRWKIIVPRSMVNTISTHQIADEIARTYDLNNPSIHFDYSLLKQLPDIGGIENRYEGGKTQRNRKIKQKSNAGAVSDGLTGRESIPKTVQQPTGADNGKIQNADETGQQGQKAEVLNGGATSVAPVQNEKVSVSDARVNEHEFKNSDKFEKLLTLDKNQDTGWRYHEYPDGIKIFSYDGKAAKAFIPVDKKSGTYLVRARQMAHAYAIDNPYQVQQQAGAPSTGGAVNVGDYVDDTQSTVRNAQIVSFYDHHLNGIGNVRMAKLRLQNGKEFDTLADSLVRTQLNTGEQGQKGVQESAGAEAVKPAILSQTEANYIKAKVKEQNFDKKSPGYTNAIVKARKAAKEEYATELDKALAGLSLDDYIAWEKSRLKTGEKANSDDFYRQSHEALKAEYLSKNPEKNVLDNNDSTTNLAEPDNAVNAPQDTAELFKSFGKSKKVDTNHPQLKDHPKAELIANIQNHWQDVLMDHAYEQDKKNGIQGRLSQTILMNGC